MKFLIDAQLPPALARLLEDSGHEASHVADVSLRDAGDTEIWDLALTEGMVIVTKDEDFAHRQSQLEDADLSPAIVWLRVGNTSNQALIEWFEPLVPSITTFIESGQRLLEFR